jgi:hypothetical protein
VTDVLAIAKACERQTTKAREAALVQGLQDAKEVGRRPISSKNVSLRCLSRKQKKDKPKKTISKGSEFSDSSTCLTESCSSLDLSLTEMVEKDCNGKLDKRAQQSQKKLLKKMRLRWKAGPISETMVMNLIK